MSSLSLSYLEQIVGMFFERHGSELVLKTDKKALHAELVLFEAPNFVIRFYGQTIRGRFFRGKDFVDLHLPDGNYRVGYPKKQRAEKQGTEGGELTAPMPGKIVRVYARPGDKVEKGGLILVLEAMKMEHKITSPGPGVVHKIFFDEGERASQGDALAIIHLDSA